MPVIILVGGASSFSDSIHEYFKDAYRTVITSGPYVSVRSSLANMKADTLYIVPGLSKPERYEIFCLARKNATQFISLAIAEDDGLVSCDKNPLIMPAFDGSALAEVLSKATVVGTVANKRSKFVNMRKVGDVNDMITHVNETLLAKYGQVDVILRECESLVMKMASSNPNVSAEDLKSCYTKMAEAEIKKKHSHSNK